MKHLTKSQKLFRSPLARRLTISIILVSSVITLLLTCFQLYWTYHNEIRGIHSGLAQIEQVHLKVLSQSLWAANTKELNLQLDGIVQMPNIVYSAVNEGDRQWAAAGQKQAKNIIERSYPLTYQYRHTLRRIGTLTVYASVKNVYKHVIEQAAITLASNAFKTFLVAGFMLLFFHKQVNRYLLMITDYIHKLDINEPSPPLVLSRSRNHDSDEFDELVDVINQMHDNTHQAHSDLNQSKDHFHAIADYTIDWESWIGTDGALIWVNPSVTRMTGYTTAECYAMNEYPLPMIANTADQQRLRGEFNKAARGSTFENLEFQILHKEGMQRWIAMSWQPIYGPNGEFKGYRSSARDITDMKVIEEDLQDKLQELAQAEDIQKRLYLQSQQEKARMTSLLAAMNIGILFEDINNNVMYFNPTFRRIWLIPESINLAGQATCDVLEYSANVLARPDHFSKHILHVLGTHEVSETFEINMADGRVVTQISYPVHDQEGRYIGRLWLYEDVTHERQTAEQLIYLAERDSLTGLYNRHRFQEELARMLVNVDRHKSHGALLFFDLDEFKYINDNFGHRAGDAMLIRVAGEVSALIRRNEIIARIGGDEFAILIPDATEAEAIHLAERIIRSTSQIPFRFEGQNLRLTTSLGIALYPEHGANADDLTAHADAAMYQAKDAGKNAWRVYRQDLDASREMLHRLGWHERVSNALENDLLQLHFQGIYHASDGRLCHLEALVRMIDEANESRIIMPGHFIPAAEKTGNIIDIDRWVILESIRLLAETPDLPAIAVNISGRSFDDPGLPQFISQQLNLMEVEPSRLMVELTETSAVSDLHDAQRFIETLHKSGCHVCLDDFGSGFSSFAYLKHLKADILKIDGLFIRDLPNDHDNQVFVKSIVDVARGMRKQTVAEFVEDTETLEMLRIFGVDLVQGYYLDMPQANHPALQLDTFENS